MGANTYRSIGKPLPNRNNIVLSIRIKKNEEGVTVVRTVTDILSEYTDIIVVGGSQIYKLFLPDSLNYS